MLPRQLKTDGSKTNRHAVLSNQAKRKKKDLQSNDSRNSKSLKAQAGAKSANKIESALDIETFDAK